MKPPPEDIAKLLPPEKSAQVPPTINETEFPLKLPAGFKISIFAKGLGSPRVMTYDPAGNIVVSIPAQGKVVALPDAESNQVAYYDYDTKNLKTFNKRKIIDLPSGGNHITRTILFMPSPNDHKLLTSVGSTCNVCEENDWRRAKILISNADGGDLKTFASGLRNSVFMAIHPVTGKIWATEMGRDLLGDDLPPDEINIVEEDKDYGWPYFYGKDIRDAAFEPNVMFEQNPDRFGSHIDIPAHSSPLGLAFI
ncbi:MAG: L-sorbosone dehydrogenase, partial [Candidatus Azambacteria bacterium GW2011_GWA2_45_90]